jgi:hypothetical protein
MLTRAWGFAERLAQRHALFPDGLRWMAASDWKERLWSGSRSAAGDDAARRSVG